MAELVVSMAIGPLVSMLRDKASIYLLDQYNVMEGMEEQHKTLKRKLPAILDVITDAEEQAMAHREGAKAWLQDLKTVAYVANDVFDEFKYEALRREAKKNGHYRKLGFDGIKLFPTHNRVEFRRRMSHKLCQILQDIEVLVTEMHAFRFKFRPQPSVSKQWRQTDYVIVDPQDIARRSRDKEKKNIVEMLLGRASNADLTVVPIVGMGGLGKTTLAQLIFNEPQIQKHFQLLLWICVSDTFDVNFLAKSIVEASPKKNEDTDKPPLDRLQKLVRGQRYLLVLDDVWNREVHKWERLKVCLQHGGTGSVVLTTTRDNRVAEIMGTDKPYPLKNLEDSFLKEIIEVKAFGLQEKKPAKLVEMVGEIAERCSGSPLAATALGSVLRTKTSVKEWKAVLSRSSICTEETGILPILKLSYNDLPSHMKQCFAFCAVFPKDYKIDVDKLIQLWIANGFIPEHKEDSLETIGKQIFRELASRSFFMDKEESKDDKHYSRTTWKIHDLMHDIAMFVMEKECVVANKKPSDTEWFPDTARHLFLSSEVTEGILNDSMEKRSPAIQTLLLFRSMRRPLQHLSKYKSLHALQLCTRTESFLLQSKYLHHLRYLDLSNSFIEALPEDISILYNLQMLDLSYCSFLHQLPRQMKYMTSLRHLYTHECRNLKSMPPELGKLTKLQTLTYFVAAHSGPDCSDVAELKHLNLGGQLELCQVENIDIEAEAKLANLGNKNDLKELRLRWTFVCDSEVLTNFKPHDGLEVLMIYSYGGKCMGMLQNMVEIHLFHCERLQVLFRCGTSFTFPKLKQLTLEDLLDFERWWEINERREGQIIFPVLEKLFIRYCRKMVALPEAPLLEQPYTGGYRSAFPALKVLEMEELESFQKWDDAVGGEHILFPHLEKLSIQKCPKLMDLPGAPKLSVLEIRDGKQELFHWVDRYLSSLTELTLKLQNTETASGSVCTSMLPVDSREKWNQKSPLTVLELGCCNTFFGSGGLEPWDYFVHLGVLRIDRCDVLIHWPEVVFNSLVSLKTLNITWCNHLTGYTQAPVQPSVSKRSQHLPALEYLRLEHCASLVEMFNVPASLKRMNIMWCSKVESIFGKQQVGTSELVQGSSCSEAVVPTAVSQLSPSPVNHFRPCLEYLWLSDCDSLSGVLHLPPSLKSMNIWYCSSIQVLSCQLDGLPKPEVTASINAPDPTAATATGEHSLPPGLTSLEINSCAGMLGGVLRLPTSLKTLSIKDNSWLTSLVPVSGQPLSLEDLCLIRCSALASLPNEPQAYLSSLSLTKLTLKLQNTETASGSVCTSVVTVDSGEKWNQKSPLTVLELGCCNTFFGSGGLEPWDYFVHLGVLRIDRCDVLIHWPEVVFNSLVSLKTLNITWCNHLTGYTQAPVQPSVSKRSQHLPALESLRLEHCASLVEMFNVPASLKRMAIEQCSKLESIFGKQQLGTSELVQGSSCSETVMPTAVSQLSPSPVNHFCPCLEYLWLIKCDSLSGVLHLPPSLKTITIWNCSSIQVLSCQLDGLPKPEVTASINAPDPSAATVAGEHSLPPCLTYLNIQSCAGMLGGILRLPTSLKELIIRDNSWLTSLEPMSGQPLSLGDLCLVRCSALASLPNEPQAYGSLFSLEVKACPAIKKLPICLQQRLGSIDQKCLDAQYEVMAFKPKTWKEIPRLVCEWMEAKWRAEERKQANRRAAN